MAKNKVLIVDDEIEVVEELSQKLTRLNLEIISARNGDEAIIIAMREKPNLILLDIVMPGVDGWDTCIKLKELEDTKDIPVIMLSALSSESSRKLAKGFCGAADFLNKKADSHQLLKKINEILKRKEGSTFLTDTN